MKLIYGNQKCSKLQACALSFFNLTLERLIALDCRAIASGCGLRYSIPVHKWMIQFRIARTFMWDLFSLQYPQTQRKRPHQTYNHTEMRSVQMIHTGNTVNPLHMERRVTLSSLAEKDTTVSRDFSLKAGNLGLFGKAIGVVTFVGNRPLDKLVGVVADKVIRYDSESSRVVSDLYRQRVQHRSRNFIRYRDPVSFRKQESFMENGVVDIVPRDAHLVPISGNVDEVLTHVVEATVEHYLVERAVHHRLRGCKNDATLVNWAYRTIESREYKYMSYLDLAVFGPAGARVSKHVIGSGLNGTHEASSFLRVLGKPVYFFSSKESVICGK